ncbi:hypothetical protein HU200_056381 [Digitaria exilis]|uniref:Uncharacterized protein n=1 Tax=Digitaria exilis TaxID=1010633 RepID=A0A835E5U2_9POAL|nr:hypothetical protein HU200_056381 [Digitaria exilis]CAB3466852.1 unnamed protein product [Digitaria exilis]
MASSKSIASPVLVFLAMALMLAACAQAQAPAPAPAPSQGSCPPGFKNYFDLTDYLRATGRELIMDTVPGLLPTVKNVIGIIPHTGLKLCVCFRTTIVSLPIQCVSY